MLTNLKLTPSLVCALVFGGRRKQELSSSSNNKPILAPYAGAAAKVRGVRKNRPSSANPRQGRDLTFQVSLRSLAIVRRLAHTATPLPPTSRACTRCEAERPMSYVTVATSTEVSHAKR